MKLRSALVAAVLALPLLALPSSAASGSGCLTLKDPKGDTAPLADPALDLTGFTLRHEKARLVAQLTVDRWSVRPMYAPDSRMEVNFTVGAKRVTLFYKSSLQRAAEANAFFQQGIRVDDVFVSGDMDATVSGNTLTMRVKLTVLRTVLAQPVLGVPFTKIDAAARANFVSQNANVTFDSAEVPAATRFVGGGRC